MKTIFRPAPIVRHVELDVAHLDERVRSRRGLFTEWIVTNGLGGYLSGTVGGLNTRRYHGWLIAALPAPHGRTIMLNQLRERLIVGDQSYVLDCDDLVHRDTPDPISPYLSEFRLENGLPVWVFRCAGNVIEKRACMVHLQNTAYITYTLLEGEGGRLEVQPAMHVRSHDDSLAGPPQEQYRWTGVEDGFELYVSDDLPVLKLAWNCDECGFQMKTRRLDNLRYRIEQARGYDWEGSLWSPGKFATDLRSEKPAALTASTEDWEKVRALSAGASFATELERKRRLLRAAPPEAREGFAAELVFAADQFLITPMGRTADQIRAHAVGDEIRTVIAGYHWFTDWGRDTMISLEGLTLSTGRYREAEYILRSFGNYIHNGLIPNMFPEGRTSGLYHTADATLWFFHAIDRYVQVTSDWETLEFLLPKMVDVAEWHLRGTDFGIHIDQNDGLMVQGQDGYQLTWMDAKVGDWVVTPRRGKTVELNALWYNALRLLVEWLEALEDTRTDRARYLQLADRCRESFNRRFWNGDKGCLFDVVDTFEGGDDAQIRPNQLIAISLKYPVLDEARWKPVVERCMRELLTPVGLRSLARGEKDYKPRYDGDLWARDAAYHQGTVWGWLIGPFVNAWMKTFPEQAEKAQAFLHGFDQHLYEDGVGTISEIFDAEEPFTPRGCMAQAWSVAEVLRCEVMLHQMRSDKETQKELDLTAAKK
ncbi:glycogen debranching protein [Terriglobus albidus]|uniref:Glycogen debranching protein n=1 Tax=Terriglobus albidus TaxID=1592106 RepID=A0A5B9EBY4_9BACT|nr:amylo-alpha-1,6-glucosidase [Terriglobus albidus]QEE29693.1 glycogen debranching protein [Terriglobus albidus]